VSCSKHAPRFFDKSVDTSDFEWDFVHYKRRKTVPDTVDDLLLPDFPGSPTVSQLNALLDSRDIDPAFKNIDDWVGKSQWF
jgi:hypothetical protein